MKYHWEPSHCSKSLTYRGLVDHGEDYKATDINEKANSGLIIVFQPFADSYSQPVAVFASRGPVVGTELAQPQLIIKCIILLEQAGALIHSIVSSQIENRKILDWIRCQWPYWLFSKFV